MKYRVRAGWRMAVLGDGELVVGRSPYCSLVLDDPSISRLHAVFRRVGDAIEVTDLGSTLGTFVGGRRITEPTGVAPGIEVRMGAQSIFVEAALSPDLSQTAPIAAGQLDDSMVPCSRRRTTV